MHIILVPRRGDLLAFQKQMPALDHHLHLVVPKSSIERARAIAGRRRWTLTAYINNAMLKAIVADEKEAADREVHAETAQRFTPPPAGFGSLRERLRERRIEERMSAAVVDVEKRPSAPAVHVHVSGDNASRANEPPIAYLANVVVNGGPIYGQRERHHHAVEILKGAAGGDESLRLKLIEQLEAEIERLTTSTKPQSSSWLSRRAMRSGL